MFAVFFSSRRRHTRLQGDWSSDVCSSDLDDFLVTPRHAQRLEVLETHVEPHAGSGRTAYTHPGDEECILVIEGSLTVWLNESRYDLTEGDALTFPCRTPHRWENPSASPTRVIWIVTPAGY